MKTIYNKGTRDELIARIKTLDGHKTAQWGKMTVGQMLKHCTLYEELLLGKKKFKRIFIGYIFGRFALKSLIGDASELKRDMPTIPEIKVVEDNVNIEAEKEKWIAMLEEHAHYSAPDVVHPFCGKVTEEQVGYLSYKHTDHHLRQFNC